MNSPKFSRREFPTAFFCSMLGITVGSTHASSERSKPPLCIDGRCLECDQTVPIHVQANGQYSGGAAFAMQFDVMDPWEPRYIGMVCSQCLLLPDPGWGNETGFLERLPYDIIKRILETSRSR